MSMRKNFGVSVAAGMVLFLALLGGTGEAIAHGPRGGMFISSGGFSFGMGGYGGTFFGIDSGSGISLWLGSPPGRYVYPRYGRHGGYRYGQNFHGPPPPRAGRIVIIDGNRLGAGYGGYGGSRYGRPFPYRDFRSRRVWVPGRSTPWGYVPGGWEMRPLPSKVPD